MAETIQEQVPHNEGEDEEIVKGYIYQLYRRLEQKENILQWQMDVSLTTAKLISSVSGFFYNEKSKKLFKHSRPTLNATGVLRFGDLCESYLSKDMIQSNFSLGDIKRIMSNLIPEVIIEFNTRRQAYGVDMARFKALMLQYADNVYSVLSRALDDGTRKHNETFFKIVESLRDDGKQKKKSSFYEDTE